MGEKKFYANKSINYACAEGKNEVPHQNSAQCSFISCNDRLSVFYHAIILYCRVFMLLLSSSSSSLFVFSFLSGRKVKDGSMWMSIGFFCRLCDKVMPPTHTNSTEVHSLFLMCSMLLSQFCHCCCYHRANLYVVGYVVRVSECACFYFATPNRALCRVKCAHANATNRNNIYLVDSLWTVRYISKKIFIQSFSWLYLSQVARLLSVPYAVRTGLCVCVYMWRVRASWPNNERTLIEGLFNFFCFAKFCRHKRTRSHTYVRAETPLLQWDALWCKWSACYLPFDDNVRWV